MIDLKEKLSIAEGSIRSGEYSEAIEIVNSALQIEPDDIQAYYLLAVAYRYSKKFEHAIQALEKLLKRDSQYGRAYQEKGHNLFEMGRIELAISEYENAIKFNPALIASWKRLKNLYSKVKNPQNRDIASEEVQRLENTPPPLVRVMSLIHEGKLFAAENQCRHYLKQNPKSAEGMGLLANIAVKLFVYDDAEFLLESAVEFEPDNWRVRHDYVNILYKRQKYEEGLRHATVLLDRYPENMAFKMSYANQNVALGNFDEALDIYQSIADDHPGLDIPHLMMGHAYKTIGRVEDGIESYRSAYKVRSDFGDAFWSLANLKTYKFPDEEIALMKEGLKNPATQIEDKFHLAFALGKAFEDRKQFSDAFQFYQAGNELKSSKLRFDPEFLEKAMQRQREYCNASLFEAIKGHGVENNDPIFIVGLPRAGSTLLEQILASHSKVDGTMELPNIIALTHQLNGRLMTSDEPRYPRILSDLKPDIFKKMGAKYIEDTKCHRKGAPYFIDKMPNNFMHIGLIKSILPNAKIIDARRDAMACCFSGYKQLFADGQEFTYSLENIGRYYRNYVGLMEHWDEVFPGEILRVQYEDVVQDFETQVRRILEYCNLDFEQNCLDFYKTKRSVRTPSSEQVRQPIYTSGMEQWRNFEPFLKNLRDALE